MDTAEADTLRAIKGMDQEKALNPVKIQAAWAEITKETALAVNTKVKAFLAVQTVMAKAECNLLLQAALALQALRVDQNQADQECRVAQDAQAAQVVPVDLAGQVVRVELQAVQAHLLLLREANHRLLLQLTNFFERTRFQFLGAGSFFISDGNHDSICLNEKKTVTPHRTSHVLSCFR